MMLIEGEGIKFFYCHYKQEIDFNGRKLCILNAVIFYIKIHKYYLEHPLLGLVETSQDA